MKKLAIFLSMSCVMLYAYSQLNNCNPDPNGDPWYVGGIESLISPEEQLIIDEINEMVVNCTIPLPSEGIVDNSELALLPPA